MREGLEQWVGYEQRGFVAWDERLRELLSRDRRFLDPVERGEVEYCVQYPKRQHLFYSHAKDPGWLQWAYDQGRLKPLFEAETEMSREDLGALTKLADWFTCEPLGERGCEALRIAFTGNNLISRTLASSAADQVRRALHNRGNLDEVAGQRVAAWATLIIECAPPDTDIPRLGAWLKHTGIIRRPYLVAQILAHLLRCRLKTDTSPDYFDPRPTAGFRLDLRHTRDNRPNLWWPKLKPHLRELSLSLVPVLTESFETRWRWQVNIEGTEPQHDPWARLRPWVSPPESVPQSPSRHTSDVHFLVDIAREVLDQILIADPRRAKTVIELWLECSAPQLRQLGLYGIAKSEKWRPGQKFDRLLLDFLPAVRPYRPEVFRVMAVAYPQLIESQRRRYFKKLKRAYSNVGSTLEESQRYKWYGVLTWLDRHFPEDLLIRKELESLEESYPDFTPPEHPNLSSSIVSSERSTPPSPLGEEEILRLSPSEWLIQLGESQSRESAQIDPHTTGPALIRETARAASKNFSWGLKLAKHLQDIGETHHPVWPRLIASWEDHIIEEWASLYELIRTEGIFKVHGVDIAWLLSRIDPRRDTNAAQAIFNEGLALAREILPQVEDVPYSNESESNWLNQSVNHPGGNLAEFALQAIHALLGPSISKGTSLPRAALPLLNALVTGPGNASQMGLVFLAAHTSTLAWIDPEWFRTKLLPLFDWGTSPDIAPKAWGSFLEWGYPTPTLMDEMQEELIQLPKLLKKLGGGRNHYGSFIWRAALHYKAPFGKPWFQAFLNQAEPDDFKNFAWALEEALERSEPGAVTDLWNRWLSAYLNKRSNSPSPPSGEELEAYFSLAPSLSHQLEKLISWLEAAQGKISSPGTLLTKLEDDGLRGADPDLLARLTLALLDHSNRVETWELISLSDVIDRLRKEGASQEMLAALKEKYLEHGGTDSDRL